MQHTSIVHKWHQKQVQHDASSICSQTQYYPPIIIISQNWNKTHNNILCTYILTDTLFMVHREPLSLLTGIFYEAKYWAALHRLLLWVILLAVHSQNTYTGKSFYNCKLKWVYRQVQSNDRRLLEWWDPECRYMFPQTTAWGVCNCMKAINP